MPGHRALPRGGLGRSPGTRYVYLCALARDFCVRWSAEDATDAGFETVVIWDLTRPVDPESDAAVAAGLRGRGVSILSSDEL